MAKAQLPGKAPPENKKKPVGKTQKISAQESQAETPSLQETVHATHQSSPQNMQMLQHIIGNRAVQGLVEKKQNQPNESTVIQRHVSSMDQPMGSIADGILTSSAEEVGHGYGGLLTAQIMLENYRQSAESYIGPLPGGNASGGPGTSDSADQGEEIVM